MPDVSEIYNGSDTSGILLEEYTYHPTQERVLKKKVYNNDSSLKETVYYISKSFVRVVNSSGSYDYTYVHHNGQLVAQVNPDGSKYFIHTDHIGSVSIVTNESGDVVEQTFYSPYGQIESGGSTIRFGYEAKEYDSLITDLDFHFRKYLPQYGIFAQPDTLVQNVYDRQSLNRYMFERGNPVRQNYLFLLR
jgi:RHS repeat-associated protein